MSTKRMAGQATIENGSFEFKEGKLVPTENTNRILAEGRKWNPELNLQPYNSVEAVSGVPKWGSGSGHYNFAEDPNKVYVDPIAGDTHVVAHEVGHAVAPANLTEFSGKGPRGSVQKFEKQFNPETNIQHPENAPAGTGARVRAVYELAGKPTLIEEASAQGFAIGLQNKLGIPYTNNGYDHVYDYPAQSAGQAINVYKQIDAKDRDFNQSELEEIERIGKSHRTAVEREYMQGYNRAINGPR